jgi:hypothetical protein
MNNEELAVSQSTLSSPSSLQSEFNDQIFTRSEVCALNLDLFQFDANKTSEDVLSGARSASSPEIAFVMKI